MTAPAALRITDPEAFVVVADEVAGYFRRYPGDRPSLFLHIDSTLGVGLPRRYHVVLGRLSYSHRTKTVTIRGPLLASCADELIDCFANAGVTLIVRE